MLAEEGSLAPSITVKVTESHVTTLLAERTAVVIDISSESNSLGVPADGETPQKNLMVGVVRSSER